MNFKIERCPKCGKTTKIMFSNNPIAQPICFDCIKVQLNGMNLEHGDFFCRTYNIEFNPERWMTIAEKAGQEVFETYASMFFDADKENLYYQSTTKDVWKFANKEWEKMRTQIQIINKLKDIKESFIQRAMLKWGEKYSFEQLIKLENLYSSQIKANNIINPLQKEAVRTLCKLQIEMDEAMKIGDTKALKDYSASYGVFAKQAQLEDLISETKTNDITTVAELYDYMERSGFEMKYYDGVVRDEIDQAIKDIQESNRRFILESTGIGQTLEDMARKRQVRNEENKTQQMEQETSIEDLINFHAEDMMNIAKENDDEVIQENFED